MLFRMSAGKMNYLTVFSKYLHVKKIQIRLFSINIFKLKSVDYDLMKNLRYICIYCNCLVT